MKSDISVLFVLNGFYNAISLEDRLEISKCLQNSMDRLLQTVCWKYELIAQSDKVNFTSDRFEIRY